MHSRWRTLPAFVRIGSTGKTRGIDGEIKLYIEEQYLEDTLRAEFLFLERDGNKVPLQIESIREIQDVLVKFNDINDPTAASKWTSANVFLPVDEISSVGAYEVSSGLEYNELIGFIITDLHLGNIGQIVGIREFPQQEMAVLQHQNREVLVPLNPVFIMSIDHEQQTVNMDLPAGLLEI